MTFTVTPNSGDSLGGTRDLIRDNFNVLRSNDAVNHYDTNDVTNRGKHKQSLYVFQASAPSTASGEGSVYTRDVDGVTTPFYKKDNIADEYPMLPLRALMNFSIPGGAGPVALTQNGSMLNIATATKTNIATLTFTFTTAFIDTNYIPVLVPINSTAAAASDFTSTTLATGSLVLTRSSNWSTGSRFGLFIYYYKV